MTSQQRVGNKYDARIQRAEKLIAEKSSASELLSFYRHIAKFQKSLLTHVADASSQAKMPRLGSFRDKLELELLLPHFQRFLSTVEQNAPDRLAAAAREFGEMSANSRAGLLEEYWKHGGSPNQQMAEFEQFFPRAFLQPYATFLAERTAADPSIATPRVCPVCGGQPLLGVLRVEGDGGKRFLLCSFCEREWDFRRILCPACGEEDEKKLPVYVAEQFPQVRMETCETCKFFLRTIDLTKDGNAIPVVDDLAAIPLTLWAHEHGYSRLQANLLGS